jgi:hypothetical protein
MPTATTTTTNGTNKSAWDAKEIGCFWRRESKGTKEKYLTGVINLKALGFDKDVQVIGFSNKRKTKDTHPDIRLYISEKKGASGQSSAPAAAAAPAPDSNELI